MNSRSMDSKLGKDLGAAEQAIRDAADDLDARLHARAREIAGRAQSAYEQVKGQAAETFSGADAFVSERPYVSVAMAIAAGALLGFVLGLGRPKVIVIRQPAAQGH